MAGLCLLEPQIYTTHSQLLKILACPWLLVGTPAALGWSSELPGLASEAQPSQAWCISFWGALSGTFASSLFCLCHQPPSGRRLLWEVSRLQVLHWTHVYHIRSIFLLIFGHSVQMLFNLSTFSPPLFSIIYTSCCLVAEAIVFGS